MPPVALAVYDGRGDVTPEVEKRFFAKVRLPNGTWKTTYPNRLDDLNALLLELLPAGRELELMDIAVSSGVSTAEWSEQLSAHGVGHRILAGDLLTEGSLTSWGGWFALLCDGEGREPLLLEVGPVSLPVRSKRRLVRAARPVLAPALRALAAAARRRGSDSGRGLVHRTVPLVVAEAREKPEIEVVRDDVTEGGRYRRGFDGIRVANLLQRGYFDEPTLRRILLNLRARLRDGGLLAICQTVGDDTNQGTVFRLDGDQFRAEATLGGGVEIRDIVLSL
jgi:hypothetical protein